jgi:integrase
MQPDAVVDVETHRRNLLKQKAIIVNQRRRLAEKLKNPRILEIGYHTLRHWKATKLYHETKDILYVMKFLGHRSIKKTMIYIDLESVCYSNGKEEYHAKTATTKEEALQLTESGFEYVCDIEDGWLFRKRK